MKINLLKANKFYLFKRVLLYFFLTLMMAFFIFPVYWIISSSFQESGALFNQNINFIPRDITISNYVDLFTKGKFYVGNALANSILVSVVCTIACLLVAVLSAYAFARIKFKGATTFFYLLICTEMIPPISLLIPFFIIFMRTGLTNTWYGLVIGYMAWLLPIITWILYSYFKTIPIELEDSARIDGCTRVGALFRVFLPISSPGIVASGIICFIFSMGEFIFALTILTQEKARTLPIALASFVTKFTIDYGRINASAVLTFIFPVLLVLFFQRFLVKGLTSGAVKM